MLESQGILNATIIHDAIKNLEKLFHELEQRYNQIENEYSQLQIENQQFMSYLEKGSISASTPITLEEARIIRGHQLKQKQTSDILVCNSLMFIFLYIIQLLIFLQCRVNSLSK